MSMIEHDRTENRELQRTESRRVLGLAGALALPLLSLAGLQEGSRARAEVTVQAEHPEQGPIAEHIDADAILAPLAQAAIAPKISAPVRKFYVQRGARVKAGELLATLENSDLAAAAHGQQGLATWRPRRPTPRRPRRRCRKTR